MLLALLQLPLQSYSRFVKPNGLAGEEDRGGVGVTYFAKQIIRSFLFPWFKFLGFPPPSAGCGRRWSNSHQKDKPLFSIFSVSGTSLSTFCVQQFTDSPTESDREGCEVYCYPYIWLCTKYLTSLSLNFFIC